jgi:hypothetical protein
LEVVAEAEFNYGAYQFFKKVLNSEIFPLGKEIRALTDKLTDKQKSKAIVSVLNLYLRESDVQTFLEDAAQNDYMQIALRYLFILIMNSPDMLEQTPEQSKMISVILSDTWTMHSSRTEDDVQEDSLLLYIIKCAEFLYRWETLNNPFVSTRMHRKTVLSQFDWTHSHINMYAKQPDFWLKMLGENMALYKKNPELYAWTIRNIKNDSPEIERTEEGAIASMTIRDPTGKNVTSQEVAEFALSEACRWRISCGDDTGKINDFCKLASAKFGFRNTQVHGILLRLEERLLIACRLSPHPTAECIKAAPLTRVLDYLDAKTSRNLILCSRKFYKLYKLPFLKTVLAYGTYSHETRLKIWNGFLSPVSLD